MRTIDPAGTLGELVAERPARAPLLERLRLDYCCGGRQTLAAACRKRRLELDTVRAALEVLDAASIDRQRFESKDWRRANIAELCTHIVAVHHDGLRETLPRIETLLGTVVRVHGGAIASYATCNERSPRSEGSPSRISQARRASIPGIRGARRTWRRNRGSAP